MTGAVARSLPTTLSVLAVLPRRTRIRTELPGTSAPTRRMRLATSLTSVPAYSTTDHRPKDPRWRRALPARPTARPRLAFRHRSNQQERSGAARRASRRLPALQMDAGLAARYQGAPGVLKSQALARVPLMALLPEAASRWLLPVAVLSEAQAPVPEKPACGLAVRWLAPVSS